MKEHYIMNDGKLVSTAPTYTKTICSFTLMLIFIVAVGYVSYYFTWKKYALPDNSQVISQDEYKKYKEMENSLKAALEREIIGKQYNLDRNALKVVINEIFPKKNMSEQLKDEYIDAAIKWGAHYSIPPLLILSIAYRESLFDASQISSANARGPMQVIYKYHADRLKKIGKKEQDLHEIDTGIRIGTEVLRAFYDHHKKDIFKAMMSYVGGDHPQYAEDILSRYFRARIFAQDVQK